MGHHRQWAAPTAPLAAALLAAAALTAGCGSGAASGHSAAAKPSAAATAGPRLTPPAASATPAAPADAGAPGIAGTPAAEAGTDTALSAVPWCATADLRASVHSLEPAAGNRYAALQLTNISTGPCRTEGYPGIQLIDPAGHPVATDVVRDRSRPPVRLTVAPGQSAWAGLHWAAVAGAGDSGSGDCQPAPYDAQVIAPDQRSRLTAWWSLGPVCERGRIDELPLAAGDPPAH